MPGSSYSIDGNTDEKLWYRAELELEDAVYERAAETLGGEGLEQALLATGICAACWLLMDEPRTSLQVSAAAPGAVTGQQLEFWNQTLRGTLAEFQYLNRLPYHPVVLLAEVHQMSDSVAIRQTRAARSDRLSSFSAGTQLSEPELPEPEPEPELGSTQPPSRPCDGVLVPLGGGKDCLTLLELLRDANVDMSSEVVLFHLADRPTEWSNNWRLAGLHRASGVKRCVRALFTPPQQERAARLKMPLNRPKKSQRPVGMVDGTPPWAALVCFVGVLVAAGSNCGYVAVGNERSANEGSGVAWVGEEVNHQYDKAFPWERAAHEYIERNISAAVYYFSGLMHWWEVQIARKFCSGTVAARYLHLFLSCNQPVGETRWCSKCPKCCFVQLLLAGNLEPSQVCAVFGDDLLEKQELLPIYRVLLGLPDPDDPSRVAIKPLGVFYNVNDIANSTRTSCTELHQSDLACFVLQSVWARHKRRDRACSTRSIGMRMSLMLTAQLEQMLNDSVYREIFSGCWPNCGKQVSRASRRPRFGKRC